MSSIFDLYLKEKIMRNCEENFIDFLKEHASEDEQLTAEDRKLIENQVEYIIDLIERVYLQHDNEVDALVEITDRLIGICIMGKMNEARLCNVINEKLKDKE